MFSPPHVILLQPVKFRRNQAIHGRVITSYRMYKMAERNLLPGSGIVMAPVL